MASSCLANLRYCDFTGPKRTAAEMHTLLTSDELLVDVPVAKITLLRIASPSVRGVSIYPNHA